MGPYPLPSHLDYYGEGEDCFYFQTLGKHDLAVYLGEVEKPLFYAHVDPIRGRLVYVNSRPKPALLARRNSRRVIHLEHEGTITMLPGDVMVAFMGSIQEHVVLDAIRENPDARAGPLVTRILEHGHGTVIAVRFISNEEPALAEESSELTLAVA
jgi:hypothetical protein